MTDDRWFNLAFQWTKEKTRIHQYKDGSVVMYKTNGGLNVTLPELHNATIRIGDRVFDGSITSLNLWSVKFLMNMITSLALNPGNAAGDIFSWKSLKTLGEFSSPSSCHERPGILGGNQHYYFICKTRVVIEFEGVVELKLISNLLYFSQVPSTSYSQDKSKTT